MDNVRRRTVLSMYFNIFLVMISISVLYPLLSDIQDDFGVSYAAISWTATAFGLARLITNLPAGFATARFPRVPFLIFGTVLVIAGGLMSAWSISLGIFLVGRSAAGIGSGICTAVGLTTVLDASTTTTRGRSAAIYHSSLAAGAVAGPGVGGVIASLFSWRIALILASAAAALSILSLIYIVYRHRGHQWSPSTSLDGVGHGDEHAQSDNQLVSRHETHWLRGRVVVTALLGTVAIFALRGGMHQTLIPLMGRDVVGLSTFGVSMTIMTVTGIGSTLGPFIGALSDRLGRMRILLPGILLSGVGAFISVSSSFAWIFILGVVVMGIAAATNSLPPTMIGDELSGARRANAIGAYRFAGDIALTLAPISIGWLIDSAGFLVAGYAMAGLMLVVAVIMMKTSDSDAKIKSTQ